MATIQGIYIALFGRPADPAGLAYWEAQTAGGVDLASLIGRFTGEPEALERFEGLDSGEVVSLIYQSLFGRAPDAAGLEYFTSLLESGEQSLETIAINILDGAQNDDAVIIENKVEAANAFTESLDTPQEIAAYTGDDAAEIARDLISNVTSDPATIPTQEEIDDTVEQVETAEPAVENPGGGGGGSSGGGGGEGGEEQVDGSATLVVDRFAPATFALSDNDLTVTINPDGETTGFTRYQGVKITDDGESYNLNHEASVSASLTLEDDWANDDGAKQQTGIWITFQNDDATLPDGGIFSIAEFIDADAALALDSDLYTGAGFRFWNSEDGWNDFVSLADIEISSKSSVELTFEFTESAHIWYINGEQVYIDELSSNTDAADVIENVIFNSQNYGASETYTFSDISLVGSSGQMQETLA